MDYAQEQTEVYSRYQTALDNSLVNLKLKDLKVEENQSNFDSEETSTLSMQSGLSFRGKLPFIIGSAEFFHARYLGIDTGLNDSSLGLNRSKLDALNQQDQSVDYGNNRASSEMDASSLASGRTFSAMSTVSRKNIHVERPVGNAPPAPPPPGMQMPPPQEEPIPQQIQPPKSGGMPPPPPLPKVDSSAVGKIVKTTESKSGFASTKNNFQSALKDILAEKRAIVDGEKEGSLSIKAVKEREQEMMSGSKPKKSAAPPKSNPLQAIQSQREAPKQQAEQPPRRTQTSRPSQRPPPQNEVRKGSSQEALFGQPQPQSAQGQQPRPHRQPPPRNTQRPHGPRNQPPPQNRPRQGPPPRTGPPPQRNRPPQNNPNPQRNRTPNLPPVLLFSFSFLIL